MEGKGKRFLPFLDPFKTLQILLSKPPKDFDVYTYMCVLRVQKPHSQMQKCIFVLPDVSIGKIGGAVALGRKFVSILGCVDFEMFVGSPSEEILAFG